MSTTSIHRFSGFRRPAAAGALVAALLFASGCQGNSEASGADYPTRTIQMIVPYPAGGGTDTIARAIAEVVNKQGDLGQQIQVVNREGGAGTVGTSTLLNAKTDGYTIGLSPDGPYTLVPHVEEVSYDPESVTILSGVVESPVMIVVSKDSPYNSMSDLVEAASADQGSITLGEGPLNYDVPASLIEEATGASFKRINFDGDAATSTALLGGNLDAAVMQLAGALPQLASGDLKALGIASEKPSELAPEIPTMTSQGIDVTWSAFYMAAAPSDLAEGPKKTLTSTFSGAVASDEFAEQAKSLGMSVYTAEPEEVRAAMEEKFTSAGKILGDQ